MQALIDLISTEDNKTQKYYKGAVATLLELPNQQQFSSCFITASFRLYLKSIQIYSSLRPDPVFKKVKNLNPIQEK